MRHSPIRTSSTRRSALVGLLIASIVLPACRDQDGHAGISPNDQLEIVATTGIVADLVRQIAGTHANVTALMAPGVDPHLYKASEGDVRKLARADVIFYNGLYLEGRMGSVLTKMARHRPVIPIAETIPKEMLHQAPGSAGYFDPHVWFDVDLWRRCITPVVEELSLLAPEFAADFRARGEAFNRQLVEVDAFVREQIQAIPPQRRILVTAHDAFGYFGKRYGIKVVGLQGTSTVGEAGLRDVQRIVDLIVKERVPAIFVESSVPRRAIEAVQQACRARGHEVVLGGTLFSDSMGAPGSAEGTYVGMVKANVKMIVTALSRDAT